MTSAEVSSSASALQVRQEELALKGNLFGRENIPETL